MATSMTLANGRAAAQRYFEGFPVGYYDDLHPDFRINYEMNRFSTGEADMIEEMRSVSSKIHNIRDQANELFSLGEAALARGEKLKGAYYLRGAEFCMFGDDPRKRPARRKFIELMREHFGYDDKNHFDIPYEAAALSAHRLVPAGEPKGTVVVFGGFDSYIEEWFPMQRHLSRAGYDVIGFDGPGQGASLEERHLHLTHEWHKPVGAVLDYFKLDNVTLIGISLGGCLALRAAAYEPRVHRVVADDTDTDYLEVMLGLVKPSVRAALMSLLKMGADHLIDKLFERASKESPSTDFGVQQGMMVTGSKTPSEYLKQMHLYRTDDVSPLIEQDVLLLGGTEDFCIPLHQFHDQIGMLTRARSVTARLFTRQEQGQQHCQIGNLGLQFRVIKDWIEIMQEQEESTK
ncbi:MAG TPA: alpha/beta fold hydrolase [Candidatus Sulfotelmatobacter sp.]|nr:alpha/beta fold hydrolase [Candidatus Sulfotelmatobacter sp.]